MKCIFSNSECTHASCCESQGVACCHACKYNKCQSRCKTGTKVEKEDEIPEEEWNDIVKMWEETK